MLSRGFLTNQGRAGRFAVAFQAPGFLWLWMSMMVSSVGFTVEAITQGWLVLEMTDSPLWVGVVAGVRGVVWCVLSIPAGAVADRIDRRRLLVLSAVASTLGTAALAALILADAVALWHILVYSALMGGMMAVNTPTGNALTYDIVGPVRLLNANAFRFMGFSAVRVVASVAGGVMLDTLGAGGNYAVIAGASAGSLVFLAILRTPTLHQRREESLAQAVRAGVGYALRERDVRRLLLFSLVTEFFAFSYLWMLPVVARDVLGLDGSGLGYLSAAGGAGSLLATALLAAAGNFRHKGWLLVASGFGFGLTILLFGLSPWYGVSLMLAGLVGAAGSLYDSVMMTVIQLTVREEMRGRVMGLYVATWGLNQMGGVVAGALASAIGVSRALAVIGGITAANSLRLVPAARRLMPVEDSSKR
jgi:MFS family permease